MLLYRFFARKKCEQCEHAREPEMLALCTSFGYARKRYGLTRIDRRGKMEEEYAGKRNMPGASGMRPCAL